MRSASSPSQQGLALAQKVRAEIQSRHLIERDDAVLVAVSGGVDSVALLDILTRWAPEEHWRLSVAHFNHRLRGDEADADEAWVKRLAAQYGLPCLAGRGSVRAQAQKHGVSCEMAGRALRHVFLARAAATSGALRIALGHQADDQAETVLLRLLRGSGGEGLGAMRWSAPSPADPHITLVRPLLGLTRKELLRYARAAGLEWREDSSNATEDVLRNWLRHRLLPLLRRHFQPAVVTALCRTAELTGANAEVVNQMAAAWLARSKPVGFHRLHRAVQRQILRLQLLAIEIVPGFECVERLRTEPGASWTVDARGAVTRDATGRVRWAPIPRSAFRTDELTIDCRARRRAFEFAGVRIVCQRVQRKGVDRLPALPGQECFDAERVGRRIVLRHWQPGDRFQPSGMPAPVRLQNLFTNAKVPRAERHQKLVAVAADGRLFWVEGLRIGQDFRLTLTTRTWLLWRWQRGNAGVAGPAGRCYPPANRDR